MKANETDLISQNKIFLWIALVTGLLLLIPLVAMQFSAQMNWDVFDFIVMAILLFSISSLFVLVARKVRNHRLILGSAFVLVFLYIWAELAVGIFTNLGS